MAEQPGYTFREELSLNPIRPGTAVLVAGPRHDGSRELVLTMTADGTDEGMIVVTTNAGARRVVEDCERLGAQFDPEHAGIVDCVGEEPPDPFPARVLTVSSPRDLTGIGIRYSQLHGDLHAEGIDRVRSGVVSVSTLLSLGDLQQVSRFVHTLAGRITAVDGIDIFHIDPTIHDERTVNTLAQFCDGRIDVRDRGEGTELRARGLPDQSREWRSVDLPF
ncbi:MAG: hypothetical protein ABEJ06_00885 [Haloarculaceae archaeon]